MTTYCPSCKQGKTFEDLRINCPNEPEKLGTSQSKTALEYPNFPFQAGGVYAGGNKIDYGIGSNKALLPSLKVTKTFNLIPLRDEAGEFNSEIDSLGLTTDESRADAETWYGVTTDDKNFYYAVHVGTTFGVLFGGGSSTLFVARCKKSAHLVWARSIDNYLLETPESTNYLGNTKVLARVCLAVHDGRLYTTSTFTNLGPLLICMDATNGDPIWTTAYYMPKAARDNLGQDTYSAPQDIPFRSFDGTPYQGQTSAYGDLHLSVAVISEKPSIFVGTSSYQNAVNPADFTTFPVYTDQGRFVRFEDHGAFSQKIWEVETCAPPLQVGDTIVAGGNPDFDPFVPGENRTTIWRDVTSDGLFNSGTVQALVMDYVNNVPGYKPVGWDPTAVSPPNNNTMPIVDTILLVGGNANIVEADLKPVWRTAAPGIGGGSRIYSTATSGDPNTVTQFLAQINATQTALAPGQTSKVSFWAYLSGAEITAIDNQAFGASMAGLRYVATLPDGYTIQTDQEARALNYYGNSVWGQQPCIDIKNGMAYISTGQSHASPLGEIFTFEDPAVEFYSRKEPIVREQYHYLGLIAGQTATFDDIDVAKKQFMDDTKALCLDYAKKSPRGNRSYADALMGIDLYTGEILFGLRSLPSDTVSFLTGDPDEIVIATDDPDGDISSGTHLFCDLDTENGPSRTILAVVSKAGIYLALDLTGFNRLPFNHQNFDDLGIISTYVYTGPVSALGGSNFGSANTGGKYLCYGNSNDSIFAGSRVNDPIYQATPYNGYEIHVAEDGTVFELQNSFIGTMDVSKNQIVWEQPLGSLSHPLPIFYNGLFYVNTDNGLFSAFDASNGQLVWRLNGQVYGWGGISAPIFEHGHAIIINNYVLVGQGANGNTGALLKTSCRNLINSSSKWCSFRPCGHLPAYDIIPKKYISGQGLEAYETIKHYWKGNCLHATHTFEGNQTTFKINIETFIFSSKQAYFQTFQTGDLRYLSITFLNKSTYVLKFQRLLDGMWTNFYATFGD